MGWTKRSRNIYVAPCENFGHMWTAKAQISLRIRAVWSGPWLSANRNIGYYRMHGYRAKVRVILCACEEWSIYVHFAHVRRQLSFMLDTANLRIVLRIRVFSKNYLKYLFSVHSHFVETVLSLAYWYLAKLYSPLFLGIVPLPFSLFKLFEIVVFRSFSVVRDRVIAYWFRDKLALAFGIAVSTMGMGSVLTFLLTSNMAQWIGLTSTLFAGKSCSEILIGFVCCFFDLSILIAEQIIFKEIKDVSSIGWDKYSKVIWFSYKWTFVMVCIKLTSKYKHLGPVVQN